MNNEERQELIRQKGFNIHSSREEDAEFGKIKVGAKTLQDAVLNLGSLKTLNRTIFNKAEVYRAIYTNDLPRLRLISAQFYKVSGIYQRVCDYFAFMYRYDWYIASEFYDDNVPEDKIKREFSRLLKYFDNSYIKKICGDIALAVIKQGCYYAYVTNSPSGIILQELPVNYCRSRFNVNNLPLIEFNLKFFDDNFSDSNYRMKVLKMFPEEFQKAYVLYKQHKLDNPTDLHDNGCWYPLNPEASIKFSFNKDDYPVFINAIPLIIDLDQAQDLDRRKQMQRLLKIIVQKLPLDKNSDLVFDVDEAKDIHNNAVEMLAHAIGVDVLTTFTDVESIDLSDKNTTSSTDDLERVERAVYNAIGTSRNLFNATGNLSLEKSILDDESSIRPLLLQFQIFFDKIIQRVEKKNSKFGFRFYMLETTQYNYREIAKLYKEQAQLGYAKLLPQIALGHSQSSVLNMITFENQVLHLSEIMIPPVSSSTMNAEGIKALNDDLKGEAGRPEKSEEEKSDKTLANEESLS